MQLLHDAALIGKAVEDGTAKLDLTLSCKSTLLANDKSLGKLIVSHPFLSRDSSCRPGDRNCSREKEMCSKAMEAHVGRQTKGQESQPSVQDELGGAKTHDDGHPHCSNLWTHCTRSVHRSGRLDVQELKKMGTVMGKTQACAMSTVAWFFGEVSAALLPESNKSASGSRCAGVSMSTQDAEIVRS